MTSKVDLFDSRSVPLSVQIEAAEREVRMREQVYPRRVMEKRMAKMTAERELEAMRAIVQTLRDLAKREGIL